VPKKPERSREVRVVLTIIPSEILGIPNAPSIFTERIKFVKAVDFFKKLEIAEAHSWVALLRRLLLKLAD
jgi:hypothetical protein